MSIEHFKSPASTRIVAFNSHLDNYALLEEVSLSEMREIIAEYEKKRIDEHWEEAELPMSKKGNYIGAFERRNELSIGGTYSAASLQRMSGTALRGAPLIQHLQNLPLPEQQSLVLANKPKNLLELREFAGAAVYVDAILAPDFNSMLDEAGTPEAFISTLIEAVRGSTAPLRHPFRYCELLTLMWAKGLLLFPFGIGTWPTRVKWTALANPTFGGARSELIRTIYSRTDKTTSDPAWTYSCTFFACADVRDFGDLSADLVARFTNLETARLEAQYLGGKTKTFNSFRGKLRSVNLSLLRQFNHRHPEHAVALKRPKRAGESPDTARVDGKFNWLVTKRPQLKAWANCFREFVASLEVKRTSNQINRLNKLGDYLCTLDDPPATPWEIVRHKHIYDATRVNQRTFRQFVNDLNIKDLNNTLATARDFFDWLHDYLVSSGNDEASRFKNPILSSDWGKRGDTSWKTHRDSLPPYVVNELKQLLIENDFAFSKKYPTNIVQVVDSQTGQTVRTHYPGLAICLFTLLDTPIRSHQARWLDSGLLDEFVYDGVANTRVPNPSPNAISRRNEGVLRLERDGLQANGWLSLWINTNKTAEYESRKIGYSIPFVSTQLSELLQQCIAWQSRYLPALHTPIPYLEFRDDVRDGTRPDDLNLQSIAPLFRDPRADDQRSPISYPRLKRFYIKALEQAQKNIEKKYGHKLKLVKDDGKGGLTWTVDLHSLRVSGISNLIEAGVPIEVVSQFVAGHATLVMTLHYLKFSPAKLQKFLASAHERMLNDEDFVGSEMFMDAIDVMAPFVLSQEGAGQGAGFQALRDKTGIITINADGACPGMSCSTGGPLESEAQQKYGPVPGGQRCGLCRYWQTGPAHLLGQVASVNNLAYAIRKKGLEIASLDDERIDAEDAGNQKKARVLRDKVDLLRRELEIDLNEWVSRYQFAEKSMALLNDYLAAKEKVKGTDQAVPVPILTASSAPELKVTLEQSHEFALLDQITQLSEFTTGFRNREAELEKNTILSKMMAANGLKPFLLNLDERMAHEAGNLLSALVLQQVKSQDLDDVLSGQKPLNSYPRLDAMLKKLEENATKEALAAPKGSARLAAL